MSSSVPSAVPGILDGVKADIHRHREGPDCRGNFVISLTTAAAHVEAGAAVSAPPASAFTWWWPRPVKHLAHRFAGIVVNFCQTIVAPQRTFNRAILMAVWMVVDRLKELQASVDRATQLRVELDEWKRRCEILEARVAALAPPAVPKDERSTDAG